MGPQEEHGPGEGARPQTPDLGRCRVGVNYTPSQNWWWSWQDWDRDSIARDLDAIAALGCDHARIHLVWNIFQPAAGWCSPVAFARLGELLDLMHQRRLDACITILDGWLSGLDFTPAWRWNGLEWRQRSLFEDRWMIDRTAEFVTRVVDETSDHPATWCYDLGNEPNVLTTWNQVSHQLAPQEWAEELLHRLAERTAQPAVVGVAHPPWTEQTSNFERHWVSALWRAPIHAWPGFVGALDRFGEDNVASWAIADYLAEVAVASQDTGTRPVWIQEVGSSQAWLRNARSVDFTQQLCRGIARNPSIDTITWWCSHDLDPRFDSFAPWEYDLGLLGADNRPKDVGRAFAEWVPVWRSGEMTVNRSSALVIPGAAAGLDILQRWAGAAEAGELLALVDADRADDRQYLAARGITRVEQ